MRTMERKRRRKESMGVLVFWGLGRRRGGERDAGEWRGERERGRGEEGRKTD